MSKFDKIFEARETEAEKAGVSNGKELPAPKSDKKKNVGKIKQITTVAPESSIQFTNQTNAKRGRPTAKRSDPDFVGLTTYVRRDTHTRAKIALLQEGKGRELSELVEDLIHNWLNEK
jgi:hypothetical protein